MRARHFQQCPSLSFTLQHNQIMTCQQPAAQPERHKSCAVVKHPCLTNVPAAVHNQDMNKISSFCRLLCQQCSCLLTLQLCIFHKLSLPKVLLLLHAIWCSAGSSSCFQPRAASTIAAATYKDSIGPCQGRLSISSSMYATHPCCGCESACPLIEPDGQLAQQQQKCILSTHLLTPLKRLLRLLPELQPRRALSWAALLSEDLPDIPDSWAARGWLPVRSRLPLPPSLLSPAA